VRLPGAALRHSTGGWRWVTLTVLCVTLLLISLDNTILNVAIPSITVSLHATSSQLQWIVDAYAVVFAGLLLSLGALGDRVGRKWVFMGGLVTFGAGSAMAAFSGSPDFLIAARAVMGVGAAALMPCTLSILTNVFVVERERARAIGIWSGTAGIGVAVGPILGGLLLTHYWWGSVFLVNVPIVIVGLVATLFLVPNSRNPEATRPDPIGSLLSIAGFGLLVWAIIAATSRSWGSPAVIVGLISAAIILTGFVIWELRCSHPMLPMRFFANRRYSVAIAALALTMFALMGLFFLMTQYLQFCLGFSPLHTGLAIAPVAAVLLVAAPLSVVATRKVGTKWVVGTGLILIAGGLAGLSRASEQTVYHQLIPLFLLIGLGIGLTMAPSTESVMGSLPRTEAGVGSATSDTSMQLGGALGVAVLGTTLSIRYESYLTGLLGHLPIPSEVREVILGSVGGALAVAHQVPGPNGDALAQAAKHGFISGMSVAFVIAAATVAVAALIVLAVLPNRAAPE
jgi:EmrB/QacA subfamily drug resistance transporter